MNRNSSVYNNPMRYVDPSGFYLCADVAGDCRPGGDPMVDSYNLSRVQQIVVIYTPVVHIDENGEHVVFVPDPQVSESLEKFIIEFEMFSPVAYEDSGGNCTWGYGHKKFGGGSCSKAEWELVIGEEEALDLLREDLRMTQNYLQKYLKVEVTQYQYDALISLAFNADVARWEEKGFLQELNARDFDKSTTIWADFSHVAGTGEYLSILRERRLREIYLFRTWNYQYKKYSPKDNSTKIGYLIP